MTGWIRTTCMNSTGALDRAIEVVKAALAAGWLPPERGGSAVGTEIANAIDVLKNRLMEIDRQ